MRKSSIPILLAMAVPVFGGEGPFFFTYTHQMEEPGNLEIANRSVTGKPTDANRFFGSATEFEYGVTAWWTTEVYLEGQATRHDSALFTGYRWENRFRILPREHWINPVLYVEFENINGANRSLLEVVGNDGESDLAGLNAENRQEKKRELEAKLILSSHVRGWTIAENFIVEKNVRRAPFEFGYAVGVSRPLALAARPENCYLCPENFQAGVELYRGLGAHKHFGLNETSHYIAPTVAWTLPNGLSSISGRPGTFRKENRERHVRREHAALIVATQRYELRSVSRAVLFLHILCPCQSTRQISGTLRHRGTGGPLIEL